MKAILFSDITSFSRMMGEDEERTVELVKRHRDIFRFYLAKHGSQEKGTGGDSFFVLFDSAKEAVNCAIEIQKAFLRLNSDKQKEEQVWVRIGIHLGDVIWDAADDDIFGDAVNIAARTEPLAEPGGICVTEAVYSQVVSKLNVPFEPIGKLEMKNIADVPELYRIPVDFIVSGEATGTDRQPTRLSGKKSTFSKKRFLVPGLTAVALLAVAALIFNFLSFPSDVVFTNGDEPGADPSLLVFRFDNTTGNQNDDWLTVGLAETIEMKLSAVSGLKVFSHRLITTGDDLLKAVKKARKMGIKFGVVGSYQKVGSQIKIIGKLIDITRSGEVLISREEQGMVDDIFSLQDALAVHLAGSVGARLTPSDKKKIAEIGTRNIEALEAYSRGVSFLMAGKHLKAMSHLHRAFQLDPAYRKAEGVLREVLASSDYVNFQKDGRMITLSMLSFPEWKGGDTYLWENSWRRVTRAWDLQGRPLKIEVNQRTDVDWNCLITSSESPLKGYPFQFILEIEHLVKAKSEQGIIHKHEGGWETDHRLKKTTILELPENAEVLAFTPVPFDLVREGNRVFYTFDVVRDVHEFWAWEIWYTFDQKVAQRFRSMDSLEQEEFCRESTGTLSDLKTYADVFKMYMNLNEKDLDSLESLLDEYDESKNVFGSFYASWLRGLLADQNGETAKPEMYMVKSLVQRKRPREAMYHAYYWLFDRYLDSGNWSGLSSLINLELDRHPWVNQSFFHEVANSNQAADKLRAILEEHPEKPGAKYDLALLQYRQGNYREAMSLLGSIRNENTNFYILSLLAKTAIELREPKLVKEALGYLISYYPLTWGWLHHAMLLAEAGRIREAYRFFNEHLATPQERGGVLNKRLMRIVHVVFLQLMQMDDSPDLVQPVINTYIESEFYWQFGVSRMFLGLLYTTFKNLPEDRIKTISPGKISHLAWFFYVMYTPGEEMTVSERRRLLELVEKTYKQSARFSATLFWRYVELLEGEKQYERALKVCDEVLARYPGQDYAALKKRKFMSLTKDQGE